MSTFGVMAFQSILLVLWTYAKEFVNLGVVIVGVHCNGLRIIRSFES